MAADVFWAAQKPPAKLHPLHSAAEAAFAILLMTTWAAEEPFAKLPMTTSAAEEPFATLPMTTSSAEATFAKLPSTTSSAEAAFATLPSATSAARNASSTRAIVALPPETVARHFALRPRPAAENDTLYSRLVLADTFPPEPTEAPWQAGKTS